MFSRLVNLQEMFHLEDGLSGILKAFYVEYFVFYYGARRPTCKDHSYKPRLRVILFYRANKVLPIKKAWMHNRGKDLGIKPPVVACKISLYKGH